MTHESIKQKCIKSRKMKMIMIGPFDNKTKPEFCPEKWWEDYQNWLPKDWIAIVLGENKFRIVPYYHNETSVLRGWDVDNEHEIVMLLKSSGPLRRIDIACHLDLTPRTITNKLNSLLKNEKVKKTHRSSSDPQGKYYVTEKIND